MTNSSIWLALFTLQSVSAFAGTLKVECPAVIEATESINTTRQDWSAELDLGKRGKFLDSIAIFSGHPGKMGNLAPDKTTRKNLQRISTWSFSGQASEELWVACTYTNSSLLLTQLLPKKTHRCELTERLLATGARLSVGSLLCEQGN